MKRKYKAPKTVNIYLEESLLQDGSPIKSEPIPNGTDEEAGAKRISHILDDEEEW